MTIVFWRMCCHNSMNEYHNIESNLSATSYFDSHYNNSNSEMNVSMGFTKQTLQIDSLNRESTFKCVRVFIFFVDLSQMSAIDNCDDNKYNNNGEASDPREKQSPSRSDI